ncbi:MAG: fibronectin type III domain-containing protein [Flavobacteriales bacterium]
MKRAEIKLAVSAMSFTQVNFLLSYVLSRLTDNPNFPTPVVPLSEMAALHDELTVAISEATNGGGLSRAIRNGLTRKGKEMLSAQANYVRAICNGDPSMLESSGFDLVKERERLGIPVTPEQLTARHTAKSQQVQLKWPRSAGARGYRVFKTDTDPLTEANWEYLDFTTRARFTINGLESFKAYWFCVSALGTAGESDRSKAIQGRAM